MRNRPKPFGRLPVDPNLDGAALEITPLEHGQYCEPHVLRVKDKEGRVWPLVPMTESEKRLVDLSNTAYGLVRDYKEINGSDVFERKYPPLRTPYYWQDMKALNDVLQGRHLS